MHEVGISGQVAFEYSAMLGVRWSMCKKCSVFEDKMGSCVRNIANAFQPNAFQPNVFSGAIKVWHIVLLFLSLHLPR